MKEQKVLTGCEAVKAEIGKYDDWDPRIVFAIAYAENDTCDPTRHNLTSSETHKRADGSVICVGSYGVLQVGCLHYLEGENRNDLATNIRIAHDRVYGSKKSYRPWSQFKNGNYKKFL